MNIALGFILLLTMTTSGYGYDRITGEKFASRSEVIGENGMVATSHPLATQIGLDILKQGGTCLLYTSPSPRDATLSRMPSSA